MSSRNLRKINSAEMEADIQHPLDTELADCTDTELTGQYSAGLHRVLDQHAPLTSRKVANHPSAPWRTDSVRLAKRELCQAEHKWRSSGLTVYKELYSTQQTSTKQRDSFTMMRSVTALLLNNYITLPTSCSVELKSPRYPVTSPPVICLIHFVSFSATKLNKLEMT